MGVGETTGERRAERPSSPSRCLSSVNGCFTHITYVLVGFLRLSSGSGKSSFREVRSGGGGGI